MKSYWRYGGCFLLVLLGWAGGLCAQQSDLGLSQPDSVESGCPADGGLVRGYDQICGWSKSGCVQCRGDFAVPEGGVPIQVIDPPEQKKGVKIVGLSCGYSHCCALLTGGQVKCWGYNDYGQLGDGTTTESTDKAVYVSQKLVDTKGEDRQENLNNVKALSCGEYHVCALLTDGTVKCWGNNDKGQLGSQEKTESTEPVLVEAVAKAVGITSSGANGTCALLNDGTVKCWGNNDKGQLGSQEKTDSSEPVPVKGVRGAVAIASWGANGACALLNGGRLKCWGGAEMHSSGKSGFFNPLAALGRLHHEFARHWEGTAFFSASKRPGVDARNDETDEMCREWCSHGAGGAFCDCSSLPP